MFYKNMLISVNERTKAITCNPEFYLMKHLSHFVMPGAYRLNTSGGKDHLAFVNPDGTIGLLLVNTGDADKATEIGYNGKNFTAVIKAKSFNTLTWKP